MGGLIDLEQKGCELIGCWTHYMTLTFNLTHDLGLGFSRLLNFHIAISQEWEGQLTWNDKDVSLIQCCNLELVIWACHALQLTPNTVQCHYNAVNFLTNIHKRHHIARPLGRGMRCLLWTQNQIDILPQFLYLCMYYILILDCIITALDCTLAK